MNAARLFELARKGWMTLAIFMIVGLVIGLGSFLLQRPTYTAVTRLFVSIGQASTVTDLTQGGNYTQQIVSSYADLVSSPYVLNQVKSALSLPQPVSKLAEDVSASVPVETVVIEVSVQSADRVQAARIANQIPQELDSAVRSLTATSQAASSVKITQIAPASIPTVQSSPVLAVNVALGAGAGLILAICLILLREQLNNKVRTAADLPMDLHISVMGHTLASRTLTQAPVFVSQQSHTPQAEAIRTLRTNLQFANLTGSRRVVVVSSSRAGEGKTTTSVNLAQAIAETGESVLLIDADLRRPNVANTLGVDGGIGLTDILINRAMAADAIQSWGENGLHVLPSGPVPPNPSEILQSENMANLLAELSKTYGTILLDSPPVLAVTDAVILSTRASGVLLICESARTRKSEIEASVAAFRRVDATLLGLVLTKMRSNVGEQYSYAYYGTPTGQVGIL